MVSLPDGTKVDLKSDDGANKFLSASSSFDYFSSTLKEVRKLRNKKSLNAYRKKRLLELLASLRNIPHNADRGIFREKISESEIRVLLDYTIEEIKHFTNERMRVDLGCMRPIEYYMVSICTDLFLHAVPVSMAFESNFFQDFAICAKKWKANEGEGNIKLYDCVDNIALNTFATASLLNGWSPEKIFKKFEASGFLQQILRCSAECTDENILHIVLENLESCTGFLTRKFKIGEPCGDTLNAIILQGRCGSRLKGIARLVETMDTTEFEASLVSGACSYCSKKHDAKLRICDGCHFVFYCSRDCQRADWKSHQCNCIKLRTAELDMAFSLRMNILKFMNLNFKAVFGEMGRFCALSGLEASDLAVEITLMPQKNGAIHSLHNSPAFKVVPIRQYVSGEFARWFPSEWDTDLQRTWLKNLAEKMETECKPTSGVLMVYHANRFHVDIKTLEKYREAGCCLDDIQLDFGTSYWCSPQISMCQKHPDMKEEWLGSDQDS